MQKIIFILVVLNSFLFSNTLVVDNQPTISGFLFWTTKTSCENTHNPYRHIQDALDSSNSGDTILVCDGTYNERITVSKNNLKIYKSSNATRDVYVKNRANVFTFSGASKIEIDGLNIYSTKSSAVVFKNYNDNIVLKNLGLKSKKDTIYVKNSMGSLSIDGCSMKSYKKSGIFVNGNLNGSFSVKNSVIDSEQAGIYIKQNLNRYGEFVDLEIKSTKDIGIFFLHKINSGLRISHVNVNSKKEGIKFYGELTGQIDLDNLNSHNNSK